MKLKRLPEDFQVVELADLPEDGGPYSLYRLVKKSLTTPEAVAAVVRRWQVPRRDVSFGGLKDKHALTRQFVTIRQGPRRNLQQTNLQLEFLRTVAQPFTPRDIRGNRFILVLRDLRSEHAARGASLAAELARDGLPNYFDDQRFGSLGESGQFVARAWCEGKHERALWLAIAEANEHDNPTERRQKEILRVNWGQWAACEAALARSPAQAVVAHLARRPADFRGALAKIDVDQRGLYVSAYQSALWNRLLSAVLADACQPEQRLAHASRRGDLVFFRGLSAEQRDRLSSLALPLPTARTPLPEGELRPVIERLMHEEGIAWRQLRIKYPRDTFFSKGDRPALFLPRGVEATVDADELYAGQSRLTLAFDLPRGSYATIVVKRLQAEWEG